MLSRAAVIREIDELVYDLEQNGVDEEEIFDALKEYIAIQEELIHAAPL